MLSEMRLCSHNRTVKFREITVQDAISLSKVNEKLEEKATTWWLNSLQPEEDRFDSAEWSQEDRMLGLLYLFLLTQEDVKRNISYECTQCGERHTFLADYSFLATKNVEALEAWPSVSLLDGKYTMEPLRGKDLEELEQLRLSETDMSDNQFKLQVLAKRLKQPADELAKLTLKEYVQLLTEADEKIGELTHGIDLTTEHECPNKGGAVSRIVLPFQVDEYLPRI